MVQRHDRASEGDFVLVPLRGRQRIDSRFDLFDLGLVFGFVQLGVEPFLLSRFVGGEIAPAFAHAFRKLAPGHAVDRNLDKRPALGLHFGDDRFELGLGQPHQKLTIGKEPRLVFVGEEVGRDRAAGFAIGVDADKASELVGLGDVRLGDARLELVGRALPFGRIEEGFVLQRMIFGEGERAQLIEIDFVLFQRLDQPRRYARQPKAACDVRAVDAKAAGDRFRTVTSFSKLSKCLDLIGRMHRLSLDVLGQRGFRRIVKWHDAAGDRLVAGNGLRLGEFSKRLQAPAAGFH